MRHTHLDSFHHERFRYDWTGELRECFAVLGDILEKTEKIRPEANHAQ